MPFISRSIQSLRGASYYSTTLATQARSILPALVRPTTCPSLEDFKQQLHLPSPTPLLLPGLVKPNPDNPFAWPALQQWSTLESGGGHELETLEGLRASLKDKTVEVEIGRKDRGYLDQGGGWQQVSMPFGIFLDAFILGSIPSENPDQPLIGYVAQQDLLTEVPALAQACPSLPHTTLGPRGDREQWRRNIWIGPSGTFTPLHRDPYENLFCQVVGTKRVHLFPPTAASSLYLNEEGSLQSNTSKIPTEEPLLQGGSGTDQWPLLEYAKKAVGSAHVVLHPGDGLHIPRGWLHCVQSLSTSVSVNTWWR